MPQGFKADLEALASHPLLQRVGPLLYPDTPLDELRQQLLQTPSAARFQATFMYRACQWVAQNSMTSFTFSGAEHLDGTPTLFVSNHRDIVLDAMMLQYILVRLGLATTHIVIGANLMEIPLMPTLARLNKMYSIGRGGGRRQYYRGLIELSHQLREWVAQEGESVWIAQRNGRTKDGLDRTEPALVKMIAASLTTPADAHGTAPADALAAMHIVPVSVSYEWEPCAALKARELCLAAHGTYTKAPGEDTQSVLSGITDFKGRVHFTICPPLTAHQLGALREQTTERDYPAAVANIIDRRIADGYRLWPNTLLARRMLAGLALEEGADGRRFVQYVDRACQQYAITVPPHAQAADAVEEFRRRLLGIYAMQPV